MKKIVALITAFIMMLALAVPVFAAEQQEYADWSGTIAGDDKVVELDKYLITDQGTIIPDVSFKYVVSVPEAVTTEGGMGIAVLGDITSADPTQRTVNVYVGKDADKIKIEDVPFSPDDADHSVKYADASETEKTYMKSTQQFNKKPIKVDFSAITFVEPGVYRYFLQEDIAEDSVTDKGMIEMDSMVTGEDNTWRTIDVYVENDDSDPSKLKIVGAVSYEGKLEGKGKAPGEQVDYQYDPAVNFDPTVNLAGVGTMTIAEGIWRYPYAFAKNPGTYTEDRYEYKYEEDQGGWIEIHYMPDGQIVESNRTTHLFESYAEGITLTANTAAEALAMGAQKEDITSVEWNYISELDPSLTMHGVWEEDPSDHVEKWHVTGEADEVIPGDTYTELPDEARALMSDTEEGFKYKIKGNEIILTETHHPLYGDNSYGNIKKTLNVTNREIRNYNWKWTNPVGVAPKDYVATWNKADSLWDVKAAVNLYQPYLKDDGTPYMPDAATPASSLKLSLIIYQYAYDNEVAAQKAANYGYDKAAAETVPNGVEVADAIKNNAYVNEFESVNLTIGKTVTGNQGSKDKYFKFIVNLAKADADKLYILADKNNLDREPVKTAVTPYDAETMKEANTRDDNTDTPEFEYQFRKNGDNNATIEIEIYLQDGETLVLSGVPGGTVYTVTEEEYEKDGYTSKATITRASTEYKPVPYANGEEITIHTGDHNVMFYNDKNGVIPTGVGIGIGAAAALIGIVVVYIVVRRRTRCAYEDEE